MKRTKKIDLGLMKKEPNYKVAKIATAVAFSSLVLSGCSSDPADESYIYGSVEDCKINHPGKEDVCDEAFQEAQKEALETGPKYSSQQECVNNFGAGSCNYNSQGSFWGPLVTGFLVASVIDEVGDYFEYKNKMKRYDRVSSPVWTSRYTGSYVDYSGSTVGSKGSRNASTYGGQFNNKPKSTKATTTTMSRGGFGKTVSRASTTSNRSSWGG
jgi:uncharacterized protein YgiB involved in biofilm formation